MIRLLSAVAFAACAALAPAHAALVSIDLSGAVTGTTINGVGADFAQTFAGQTVAGNAVTGSPTGPLTLQAAGTIDVAGFDPGVSPASNSLLSQPDNGAPLSILLDANADSFAWTMGSGDGGTVLVSFFGINGNLVSSQVVAISNGYALYSISGVGTFRGITFSDNTDALGVRFQNMSYNTAGAPPTSIATPVPTSSPWGLIVVSMLLALGGVAQARRRANSR